MEELDLSANQLQMINGEMMADSFNTMKSVTLLDSGITRLNKRKTIKYLQISGVLDSAEKSGGNLTHHFLGLSCFVI